MTAIDQQQNPAWKQSRWLIAIELAIVIAIFVADALHLVYLSKTIYLFVFACLSLWLRKQSWSELGFRWFGNWQRTILFGVLLGVLMEALELFITQPLLVRWLGMQPDLEIFNALRGNVKWTLLAVAGAWTLAAFGEEMVYRGYLMNRVADLFSGSRAKWIISLLIVHIGFGFAHAYQGPTGIIDEGLMGILLGIIYLKSGRCLGLTIVVHGVSDTIDFLLMYTGHYPGM